jgi:hypothetical protein
MSLSRRFALLLALGVAAVAAAPAQSSTSSSNPAPDQAQAAQPAAENQGQLSVQARIKARRAQRRAAAIHEAYAHSYEVYTGMGYLRFHPGPGAPASGGFPATPSLERAHEYAWNVGFTHYFDERLGVTLDGRGYYASAYVWNNAYSNSSITNPAISQYAALIGPTYRFYMQPKFAVSLRVMGGLDQGNFSGDLGSFKPAQIGLWPDGTTFAASAALPVEYNMTPSVGLRVAPEYFLSGFGSTTQNSFGFTAGLVYRFGKQ